MANSTLEFLKFGLAQIGRTELPAHFRGRNLPIGSSGRVAGVHGNGSGALGRAILNQLEGVARGNDVCDADPRENPLAIALMRKIVRAFNQAPPALQELNNLKGWDLVDVPETPQKRRSDGTWAYRRAPSVLDLLYNPNPWWTGDQNLAAILFDRFRYGVAYNYIVSNADDMPLKLLYLPAVEVWPYRDADSINLIDYYEWRPAHTGKLYRLAAADVIQFRAELPHPSNDMLAISPLQGLNPQATLLKENPAYAAMTVKNGGRPGMMVIPDGDGYEALDTTTAKKMEEEIIGFYGQANAYKPLVFLDKYKVEFPDFPPAEVFSETSLNYASADICLALGVLPQIAGTVLGVKEGNMASMKQATEIFWEDCIIPLNSDIAATLTKKLLPFYEPPSRRRRIAFDLSPVRALAEDLVQRDERAINKFRWNVISLDQALVEAGYEPVGGDLGKMRYSQFVATQARSNLAPGGGTQSLPSGGGTSGDALANSSDGQNPASGSRGAFIEKISLSPLESLALPNDTNGNGRH